VKVAAGAEVTLEANPDDVSPAAARAWREAGVTRLSIGSQSFDDRVLAWMHRTHSAAQIERAVDAARGAGLDTFSLDLIFALPPELARDWDRDLARALALEPAHLSLYGLTVETGTALDRWRRRGEAGEVGEELYEAEFLRSHDVLTAAGYEHYEVSNYAFPGMRARHNSAYWERRPYLGLGPSAHSFDGNRRWWNVPPYAAWLRRLAAGGDPTEGSELLTPEQVAAEEAYLGLRTSAGLALAMVDRARVERWITAGWARVSDGRVRLTAAGWLRLDALTTDLTLVGSRY
jgi:oxygen-independent coproporphyrinogen-3 oxidase